MASVMSLKEEFLTCAICMEFYTDPCTLECQHSFCRKCVTDFIKTRPDAVQSRKIPCAFCRQDTRVPNPTKPVEEWSGQFKPSLMLKGLMDRLKIGHKQREGQDVCFPCGQVGETNPATSWCCDCEVTLCSRCANMHRKIPSSKQHGVHDLSGGGKVKQRRKVKCSEHEGEQIKYICKDCNKSACQICCTINHRACRHVVTIEAMIPEIKSTLTKEKRILEKRIQDNIACVKQEESNLQQLKDKEEITGSKIKSEIESVISLLREREKYLLKELDDVTEKQCSQHKANIKSGQITIQMYQQHFQFIDQGLQSESEMELYEVYQICQSGAITSVGDTGTGNTPVVNNVIYTGSMEHLRKTVTEMGRVEVTFQKEVSPMLQIGQKVTTKSVTLSAPVLCDTIDIKHRDDRFSSDHMDVTVLTVNGVITVVTADYNNNRLKSIYTEKGCRRMSLLALSYSPLRIVRMTRNRVAATIDDYHIVIADVTPELVLITNLKTSKQYKALTLLSDSIFAAGSSLHPDNAGSYLPPCIDILDLSGNVIRSFTPQSTGLNLLQNPNYMCTTHEGNILVTDYDSKSVYCLMPDGGVVFTYTPTGHGTPRGITVTDTGYILLSTDYPYNIILLTSRGTFIRNALTLTNAIGEPHGICFHDRDKLYVCKRGDGCVNGFRFK